MLNPLSYPEEKFTEDGKSYYYTRGDGTPITNESWSLKDLAYPLNVPFGGKRQGNLGDWTFATWALNQAPSQLAPIGGAIKGLKSIRNQDATQRARVSAPPGYSEHSTGFAIDIGDATQRETDFETEFENTVAFKWLIKNAAKFHFKLSFTKDNKYIDYEPWHWRYEGSIEALKVFESSNRKS